MSLYTKLQNTALEIITKMGQSVTILRQTEQAFDPIEGVMALGGSVEHNTVATLEDYPEGFIRVDGTSIEAGDKRVSIPAKGLGIVPSVNDLLRVGAVTYSIKSVREHNPAGTPIMYDVQVRR